MTETADHRLPLLVDSPNLHLRYTFPDVRHGDFIRCELTVRVVSERLKISPSHIHRIFVNEHQTFGGWLWDQRLAACKEALEQSAGTGLSISEIAFNHGFSNSSHFSRAFKARFGMSPSAARDRHGRTRGEQ